MKIAIISDIHANYEYLKSVLKDIFEQNINNIYCLGDLVGYYNEPNLTIDLIRKNNIICIKGNHEKYLLGELPYTISKEDIYGIERQRNIISDINLKFLSSLKDEYVFEVNKKLIFMTHSHPSNCEKYVYDFKDFDFTALQQYDYCCFGHTHIPVIGYHNGMCFVNPGSVGQPRDYTGKSSYAIIDFDSNMVSIKRVAQEVDRFIEILENSSYNSALLKILKRDKNEI